MSVQVSDNPLTFGAEDLFLQPGELLFKGKKFSLQGDNAPVLLLKNFLEPELVRYAQKTVNHGRTIAQNRLNEQH